MGIRLFLKNKPAQSIQHFDSLKPLEDLAKEILDKAKADIAKMQPRVEAAVLKTVEEIAPEVVKAAEAASSAAIESVIDSVTVGDTPQVVVAEAVEAAVEAAVESAAGPAAKSAVEVVIEKIQVATGTGKPNAHKSEKK